MRQLILEPQHIRVNNIEGYRRYFAANPFITDLKMRKLTFQEGARDEFFKIFTFNKSIMHINLAKNRLEKEVLISLFEALAANTTVTHLNIEGNQLGKGGVSALVTLLKVNKTLRSLNLDDNFIFNTGYTELAAGLVDNTTLLELKVSTAELEGEEGENIFRKINAILERNNKNRPADIPFQPLYQQAFYSSKEYGDEGESRGLDFSDNQTRISKMGFS